MARSGQLGLIKILGESSIGSGVRRVEALVGTDAFRFLATESVLVSQLSEQLKARREELPERVAALVTRVRDAERELDRLRSAQLLGIAAELASGAEDIGGAAFVGHRVADGTTADGVRKLIEKVRKTKASVVLMTPPPFDPLPLAGEVPHGECRQVAYFACRIATTCSPATASGC